MPKLIDYPRTSYTGAWEVAETVDDTGGKCALDTCARKLNRKVSGSFKAIVGSAVKFGLLTSKRELLTTTTLFRRIKHAYDKQEELLFHREAFLTPPLFTQLCRKFRGRELPVAMLDVLLIREFGVEEINAQGVAKAFTDGARMVGVLDENNTLADIDQLQAAQPPRRELANPTPAANVFRQSPTPRIPADDDLEIEPDLQEASPQEASEFIVTTATTVPPVPQATSAPATKKPTPLPAPRPTPPATADAVANLFNLASSTTGSRASSLPVETKPPTPAPLPPAATSPLIPTDSLRLASEDTSTLLTYRIQLVGPGLNTQLEVVDIDDLLLVRALLNKIERLLQKK